MKVRLDIRQPDMIGDCSAMIVSRMAAAMVTTIDQHVADAGCAHFAEGDFLRVSWSSEQPVEFGQIATRQERLSLLLRQRKARHKAGLFRK